MSKTELLDVDVIEAGLSAKLIGTKVLVYKSTASTNDIAWEYAANKANSGLAVFAESQSAGRGRHGNKWVSAPSQSILLSILLKNFSCPAELITLAAAVAAAQAITKVAGLDQAAARIKWPNDIMLSGKKVAGILLESKVSSAGGDYVIGIGINCRQSKDFFDETNLQMPATSIDLESGGIIDRNLLARKLLICLDKWIATAKNAPDTIIRSWQQLSSQLGSRLTLQCDQQLFSGNCIGIDPTKGLIMQLDSGTVRMFDAAHTTVVKCE